MSAWTIQRPTTAGWYWWRLQQGAQIYILKVYTDLSVDGFDGDHSDHVDKLTSGEWQPVQLPQD